MPRYDNRAAGRIPLARQELLGIAAQLRRLDRLFDTAKHIEDIVHELMWRNPVAKPVARASARKVTAEVIRDMAHHFFASSIGSWRVHTDVAALIASMKREGLPFNVWLIPLEISASYSIEHFAPEVEEKVWLGAYLFDKVN